MLNNIMHANNVYSCGIASVFTATETGSKSEWVLPIIFPKNDLRDKPINTGKPKALILCKFCTISTLSATVFPNPMPGSRIICRSSIPLTRSSSIRCLNQWSKKGKFLEGRWLILHNGRRFMHVHEANGQLRIRQQFAASPDRVILRHH